MSWKELKTVDEEFNPEIADPHEQRVPCVLLLDVSGSMVGEPIQQLNNALQVFKKDLAADSLASKRAEVCIITFDDQPRMVHDFARVDALNVPALTSQGTTAMGQAIHMALDEIQIRKDLYRSQGVQYTRPWIFLLTDGAPSDEQIFAAAAQRAVDAYKQNKVLFFGIAIGQANLDNLRQVSGDLTFKLNPSFTFSDFFRFVSASLRSASSSKPGDQISIDPGKILIRM